MGGSPVAVALSVADALEFCGVRYVVGGSLASSISGEPRSTLDVDIVVEISEADVPRVVAALAPEFEVDDRAVMRAVWSHTSVNVFHRRTQWKPTHMAKEQSHTSSAPSCDRGPGSTSNSALVAIY